MGCLGASVIAKRARVLVKAMTGDWRGRQCAGAGSPGGGSSWAGKISANSLFHMHQTRARTSQAVGAWTNR